MRPVYACRISDVFGATAAEIVSLPYEIGLSLFEENYYTTHDQSGTLIQNQNEYQHNLRHSQFELNCRIN